MNAKRIADVAKNNAESLAENIWLRFVARVSMIVASTVLLPVGFSLWQRTLNNIDDMQRTIATLTSQFIELRVTTEQLRSDMLDLTSDRYNGTQALRDWAQQNARDERQDIDRQRVERRVERLEN